MLLIGTVQLDASMAALGAMAALHWAMVFALGKTFVGSVDSLSLIDQVLEIQLVKMLMLQTLCRLV